jgi:hypothetical protein
VFTNIVDGVSDGWPDSAIAVGGSLAAGRVDDYSDVDLYVLCADRRRSAKLADSLGDITARGGRLLARYTASHLGAPHLHIVLVLVDGWIVKADIELLAAGQEARVQQAMPLYDPQRALAARPSKERLTANSLAADAHTKFAGWLWYTYAKAARGELFQAANSLDYLRKNAVLPLSLALNQQPNEDYRRIEERLPAEDIVALRESHPGELTEGGIGDALLALTKYYQALRRRWAGTDAPSSDDASIACVLDVIQADRRGRGARRNSAHELPER